MAIFKSYETIVEKINTIHCKENIIYVYLRSYSMESSCVLLVGISTIKEYISQKREKDLKWMKRLLYYRCFTGGHGNPLQYSHLENPMDRGGWRAAVHRVEKSQAWLKWLSTQSEWLKTVWYWCKNRWETKRTMHISDIDLCKQTRWFMICHEIGKQWWFQ